MATFKELREFTRRGAEHYGIDPSLAFAVFETESKWNPEAVSPKGALGIAQLMPGTAKDLGVNPADPWENIDGGLRYLKQQLDKFGKPDLAIAAYNAGPGAVEKAGGIPANPETPGHVLKVMQRYGEIRQQRLARTGKMGDAETPIEATKPEDIAGGPTERFATGLTTFASDMLKAPATVAGEMTRAAHIPRTVEEAKLPYAAWMQTPYEPEQQPLSQLGEALSQQAKTFFGTTKPAETFAERVEEGLGTAAGFMLGMKTPPTLYGAVSPLMAPLEGMVGTAALKTPGPTATQVLGLATAAPLTQASQYAQKLAAGVASYVRPALLGSIFSQVGGYERAKEQLGTQDALDASRWNGLAGLIMGAPFGRIMSRINLGTGGLIGNMVKGGIEMSSSMALMRTLDNAFDHMNYDDKRHLLDGVIEAIPVDATIGAILPAFHRTLKARIDAGKEPELERYVEERKYDERSKSWWIKYEHGWYEAEPGEGPPLPPTATEPKAAPAVEPKKELSETELEKKVRTVEKKHYGEKQANRVQQYYRDTYGLDFEIVDSETEGKFQLKRKAAEAPAAEIPIVETPTAEAELRAEFEQNERDSEAEIPANVPLLTPEVREALRASMERRGLPPEGLPLSDAERAKLRKGLELAAKWREEQAAKRAKEETPPATSVNPVDIGKGLRTTAEERDIDDAAVEAFEATKEKKEDKGSYVQAAKKIGLSITETKARIKWATGQSDKRPYEVSDEAPEARTSVVGEPQERPPLGAPLTNLSDLVQRGAEAPKGSGHVQAPPEFGSKMEAGLWLEDNKMIGTIVPKGKGFKILDLRPEGSAKFYSLSPFMPNSPWFSKLQEEIVKDHANWPKRISGTIALDKMKALVGKGKGKKEELEDMLRLTGLKQRLEAMEDATRDDVLNEIMSNGIEVEERWYDSAGYQERVDRANAFFAEQEAKYQSSRPDDWDKSARDTWHTLQADVFGKGPKYENMASYNLGGPREGYFELVLTSPQAGELPSDPSHFIEGQGKRQIGWVRGDWRTDAEGRRVLFIEEVQSKRHQEGREKGYRRELKELPEDWTVKEGTVTVDSATLLSWEIRDADGNLMSVNSREPGTREEAIQGYLARAKLSGVPDAPFRQSWLRLIARRLLRYAAENNADAVAWTTGEQQAERWNLRQVADELRWDPSNEFLMVYKNHRHERDIPMRPDELKNYVGTDLANKLLNSKPIVESGYYDLPEATRRDISIQYMNERKARFGDSFATDSELALLLSDPTAQFQSEVASYAKDLGYVHGEHNRAYTRVEVPDGQDFYSSKWPERIYGFARGGYEKSLLATAMKEAMGQFKGKGIGEVIGPPFEAVKSTVPIGWEHTGSVGKASNFSRQPSVSLTPEAKEFWRKNPMAMYSLSPFMMTPENARGMREVMEDQAVRGGVPRDITRGYLSDDMGPVEKVCALTQWLVDKNPRLYPIFDATHRAMERASTGLQKAIEPWAATWLGFKQEQKRTVTDTLVELDRAADELRKEGKSPYAERGITEPRWIKVGRSGIKINPAHWEQWREKTAEKLGLPEEEMEMVFQQRKMYDTVLEAKWNLTRKFYRRGSKGIQDLRHEVFELEDYFPHTRTGEFAVAGYVKLPDGTMKKVYDYAFDPPAQLYELQRFGNKFEVRRIGDRASYGTYKTREKAQAAQKKLGAEYEVADIGLRGIEGYVERVLRPIINKDPTLADLGIEPGNWRIERRESSYVQGLQNQPLLAMALQKTTDGAIRAIRKNTTLTAEQKEAQIKAYEQLWNSAVAQTLKKATMGGHWAKRSGVYGYDTGDAGKIAHAYAEQFYNTLSKMEMVGELTRLTGAIKGDRPREAKYAANYMQRVLNPQQDLSKLMYGLRGLAYWMHINPIKFFGGNITNGLVGGATQLVTDAGNKAWGFVPKAMHDAARWYAKREGLTADENQFLAGLFDSGVARPQYLDAMGMRLKQDPSASMLAYRWQQAKNFVSWPARTSEIYSRLYTALAAYRVAKAGLVNSDRAIERFGAGIKEKIEGKPTEEQYKRLSDYASKVVDDSHMIWGELNRPELVTQTGVVGRLGGSALIFRHYAQGLVHMWKSMWKEGRPGDRRGQMAMAESMAVQMLLGGMIGGTIISSAYEKFMGTSMWDDLRKKFGTKPVDALKYGPLALTGFNYHSSFDMEPPSSWEELFGVPASMVRNYQKAWQAAGVGDYKRAFEYAVPLKIARDISVGLRQHTVGLTTAGGRAIPGPGTGREPYKTSTFDMIKQFGGFTPLDVTRLQDTRREVQSIEARRQAKQDELVTRYINARRAGDWAEIDDIWAEVAEWNDKWREKGVPQLTLQLRTAINARMRPEKPSKKMRGLARRMMQRALDAELELAD